MTGLRRLAAAGFVCALALPVARAADVPVLEDLAATRERPLFAPSRRPPPPPPEPPPLVAIVPPPPPPPAPPEPPNLKLAGVVIGGGTRRAVFHDDNGKTISAVQGEEIEGWTIAEVQTRSILLRRDGAEVEMKLKEPEGPRPAATPTGALQKPAEDASSD